MVITGLRRELIEGFSGYHIFENGQVYHEWYATEWGIVQFVSQRIDRAGYRTCRLSVNGKMHTKFIHRLLAEYFIPNPLCLPEVNHMNGNKLDNRLSNLEWTNHQDNVVHAYRQGLIRRQKKRVINLATGAVFASVRQAAELHGLPYSTLKNWLNGTRTNTTQLQYFKE